MKTGTTRGLWGSKLSRTLAAPALIPSSRVVGHFHEAIDRVPARMVAKGNCTSLVLTQGESYPTTTPPDDELTARAEVTVRKDPVARTVTVRGT